MYLRSHAHSDLMEFLGEFGLVGFTLISLSFLFSCANKNFFSFKNFLLCYLLIFILIFDFSFHIPIIQLLFVLLLSISYKRSNNLNINRLMYSYPFEFDFIPS